MIEAIGRASLQYEGVALALGLGLLVGVQRGWDQRKRADGTRFAGIRTYGLFGLTGGVAGALFAESQAMATILLAATAGLVLIAYFRATRDGGSISATSSLTGLLTLACGFLAATGSYFPATTIAVSMILLLSMRAQLHRMVGRLSHVEIAAFARFALIALVILPLLPDRAYGPYDAWNPRLLWLVVVLVCGFSLLGYIAAKLLGPSRGTIATAAAGSMVSSTAVTAALAARLRSEPENAAMLNGGVGTASVVMFLRVMVLTGALAPFALPTLSLLALPGLGVSLVAAAWLLWQSRRHPAAEAQEVALRNPFDIGPALALMGLVMVMTLAAHWVLDRYGDAELAVVLALSGVVDVDSAIITMGSLPKGTLTPQVAGLVLLPPILLNTLFKAATHVGIAGWRRGWPGAITLVASVIACLAALPLVL